MCNMRCDYCFYRQKNWNYQQYGEFLITLFELWYKDWKQGKQPYIRQYENYFCKSYRMFFDACGEKMSTMG